MSHRVVAFVQARMTSQRLPGKVLASIAGEPMLARVLSRIESAATIQQTWVLTSSDRQDDAIEEFCTKRDIPCFRGSLLDVLDRFAQAAKVVNPDIIVRITADCPLVDPAVIDQTVNALTNDPSVVYAATRMPEERTFPVGIDVEVFRLDGLESAARLARKAYQREHVTPWFYDGSQSGSIVHVKASRDLGNHRWTVDTPEDLEFMRALWPELRSDIVGYIEIANILASHPEIQILNSKVRQKHYRETGG